MPQRPKRRKRRHKNRQLGNPRTKTRNNTGSNLSPARSGPAAQSRAQKQRRTPSACKADPSHGASRTFRLTSAALGISVGMIFTALPPMTAMRLGKEPYAFVTTAAALVALALGLIMPHRFAVWICAPAWRRFVSRGQPSAISMAMLSPALLPRSLLWLILAVLCLLGGLAVVLLPQQIWFARLLHTVIDDHFVLSRPILPLQHFSFGLVACIIPLGLLGMAHSCNLRLGGDEPPWKTRSMSWALVGVGGGLLFVSPSAARPASTYVPAMLAALPILFVSILSGALSSPGPGELEGEAEPCFSRLPTESDEHPVVIRACTTVVGIAAACLVTLVALRDGDGGYAHWTTASGIAGLGLGWFAAQRTWIKGVASIKVLGPATAFAGVLTGSMAFVLGGPARAHSLVELTVILATLSVVGFALGCGFEVLLHRVAGFGSGTLGWALLRGAVVGPFLLPLLVQSVGWRMLCLLVSFSLLAVAGVVVAQEPSLISLGVRARFQYLRGSLRARFLQSSS